jgi:hypothetical protein
MESILETWLDPRYIRIRDTSIVRRIITEIYRAFFPFWLHNCTQFLFFAETYIHINKIYHYKAVKSRKNSYVFS